MKPEKHKPRHKEVNDIVALERDLLSCFITSVDKFDCMTQALRLLKPEYFISKNHAIIYQCCKDLFLDGVEIDIITLTHRVNKNPSYESKNIAYDIADIATAFGIASNFQYKCFMLRQYYIRRIGYEECSKAAQKLLDESVDIFDTTDDVSSKLLSLVDGMKNLKIGKFDQAIDKSEKTAEDSLKGIKPPGIKSPFWELNNITGGFQKGKFIVIAARPSIGKTSFLRANAVHMAKQGVRVGIISKEESVEEFAQKVISSELEINTMNWLRGGFNAYDLNRIAEEKAKLSKLPLFIYDKAPLTLREYEKAVDYLVENEGCEIIFDDYIGLTSDPNEKMRERAVANISAASCGKAKLHNIPIVALAQLSRATEGRKTKRPELHDLRESGSLEQDANIVMLLHRPEKYGIAVFEDGTPTLGVCEVIIPKNRGGAIGNFCIRYIAKYAKFENFSEEPQTQYNANTPPPF